MKATPLLFALLAVVSLVPDSPAAFRLPGVAAPVALSQSFSAGWEAGWQVAFTERGLFAEFAPFPPFPPPNGDNYSTGYRMGYLAGLRRLAQRGQ